MDEPASKLEPVFYNTKDAAKLLGLPNAEVIRRWYRKSEVLQPGTEVVKLGKFILVDVSAVRSRLAKEQSQPRRV